MNSLFRKIRITVVFCVISVFLFSSCSLDIYSVEGLLHSPRLTGENAVIQKAFSEAVGTDISLTNPLDGEYRSSYVFFDLDSDGADECFVFYKKNGSPGETHVNMLDAYGGEWKSICDVSGYGSEIFKVEFVNINDTKEYELAVTRNSPETKRSRMLSVYSLSAADGTIALRQIASLSVSDCIFSDFDSDSYDELLYIYSGDSGNMYATLLEIAEGSGSFEPVSEITLSQGISSVQKFSVDVIHGNSLILMDCLTSEGRYFTEIIVFDYSTSALKRVQNSAEAYLCVLTYRDDKLLCSDINGDGITEIPAQTEMDGSSYTDENGQSGGTLTKTIYYNLENDGLRICSQCYRNYYDNYSLDITEFADSYFIVYDINVHTAFVKQKSEDDNEQILFYVSSETTDEGTGLKIIVTSDGKKAGFSKEKAENLITLL